MILQLGGGSYIHHAYDMNRTKRPITNWAHMIMGMTIFVLALVTIYKGIELYEKQRWMVILYWVWVSVSRLVNDVVRESDELMGNVA